MVFPQLSSYLGGSSSQESVTTSQSMGLDSITLGQLKAMVGSAPKPKAGVTSSGTHSTPSHESRESSSPIMTFVMMTRTPFSTRSKSSILMSKCHKWPRISELGRAAFQRVRPRLHVHQSLVKHLTEWIESSFAQRKAHVELLLEGLEHRDAEFRFTNARRLLYILQGAFLFASYPPGLTHIPGGTFAETTSPEHQLHWIFENCKVVRSANGMSNIVEAMKIACSKHDLLWYRGCPSELFPRLITHHTLKFPVGRRCRSSEYHGFPEGRLHGGGHY